MGRYDSSDEEYERERRRKPKSKRASRSRSRSVDSRKSKKSKHKKHSSSSRNRRHRSRSTSRDGHRSYGRRSRSHSRGLYRSRSRDRYTSRDRSRDYRRSKSRSRSYSPYRSRRSRSSSRGRRRRSPGSREHSTSHSGTEGITKSFADMTPTEQNQARMQLAIEKAKAADEAIRQRHGIDDETPVNTKKRQQDLQDIESEGFSQHTFSSSRHTSDHSKKKDQEFSFGTSLDFVKTSSSGSYADPDSLLHSRFSEDDTIRRERWHEQLKRLRIKFLSS